MRACSVCGKVISCGYTDELGFYSCEECFEPYMDREYEEWKAVEDDGYGGFYMVKDDADEFIGTGIYWTEWED